MSYRSKQPALPTALDFCQQAYATQQLMDIPFRVPLSQADATEFQTIVKKYETEGPTRSLESRARYFLYSFRTLELAAPILSTEDRTRLNALLEQAPHVKPEIWQTRGVSVRGSRMANRKTAIAAVSVALLGLFGLGIGQYVTNSVSGSPPSGTAQEHPPAQVVAPGSTSLQQFKQNFGPFTQVTPSDQSPQTSAPALLLVENGGYFVATKWTIAPNATGWQQNIAGNVNNVDVKGNYADITDADNNPIIVGINQAFIVSGNPGTVLLVDPTGNVKSMSLAQATAVRHSL